MKKLVVAIVSMTVIGLAVMGCCGSAPFAGDAGLYADDGGARDGGASDGGSGDGGVVVAETDGDGGSAATDDGAAPQDDDAAVGQGDDASPR